MRKTLSFFILMSIVSCKNQNFSSVDKKNVIEELEKMRKIDQEYAGVPSNELRDKYGNEKAWEIFKNKRDSIALINQLKAKQFINRYGFIGTKTFSERASGNFWIVIQHADNDIKLQEKVLRRMKKEIKNSNAIKSEYAMLEDRVNINKGLKQRFGSQLTYNEKGQAIPKNGLIDSINIDNLRRNFGLESFKEYYNDMTTMHFEMNEKVLKSRGINTPILYE